MEMSIVRRLLWPTTTVALVVSIAAILTAIFRPPVVQAATDCPAGTREIVKFDSPAAGTTSSSGVTLVVSGDQQSFTWTSTVPIAYVFAKAGSARGGTDTSTEYDYRPTGALAGRLSPRTGARAAAGC